MNIDISKIWPGWTITERLGHGGFGHVYKATYAETDAVAAVKVITIPDNPDDIEDLRYNGRSNDEILAMCHEVAEHMMEEIKVMQKLKGSANIVSIEDSALRKKEDSIGYDIYIRMEYLTPLKNRMVNDGYSPKTIKNVFLNLKAAMDKAVELKMLPNNPCTGTKLPKIPKYEPRIYDWDEIENMLSCARGTDMYFPLLLEVTTGLRRGELLAVTWDDINFETGIMHIHRNRVVANHEVIVKAPKSRAGIRDIALGEQLLNILQGEYLRYQADRQEYGSNFHDSRLLVRKEDGSPYHPHAWTKKWKRFQKANGLEENRFHDLRHSNTTALVESGVDLKTIQQRLGHSDISTTMNIYAHATKKSNREAAAKMDNAVFGRLAE